jgi:hypothetical protein
MKFMTDRSRDESSRLLQYSETKVLKQSANNLAEPYVSFGNPIKH